MVAIWKPILWEIESRLCFEVVGEPLRLGREALGHSGAWYWQANWWNG